MTRTDIHGIIQTWQQVQSELNRQLVLGTDITPEESAHSFNIIIAAVNGLCEVLPLPGVELVVKVFATEYESDTPLYGPIRVRMLRDALFTELGSVIHLYVERDRVPFWNDQNADENGNPIECHIDLHKWRAILDKLPPESARDLSEAGKCFACSRYTGCAIHLCRMFEAGFKLFTKHHGVQTEHLLEDSSWEHIHESIRKHRDNHKATLSSAEIKMYNRVRGQIIILAELWRNPSAHSGGTFYNDEEAMRIYHVIKGLLEEMVATL
jgi:hypothetical protein